MHNKILQLVFKKYWNNQELTTFEASALAYYVGTTNEQEDNFMNKLATINF